MTAGKSGYLDVTVMPDSVGKVRLYWQEHYDAEQNYSTITVTDLQGYLWHRRAWADVSAALTADDVTVLPNTGGAWMFFAAADTTLRSAVSTPDGMTAFAPVTSSPIYHNADGTKTVTLTFMLHDVTAAAVGFTSVNDLSVSQTVALTEIPRASAVTAAGSVIGAPVSIAITRANPAFTHSLTYTFAETSGVIAEQTDGVSVSWTPPMALCGSIPNAPSGVCTVTCHTYSGDVLIGTQSCDITLSVPDSVGLTVTEGWVTDAPFHSGTKAEGLPVYVQGYSAAQVTFDESKIDGSGAYGAAVKAFSLQQGTADGEGHWRTGVLTVAGETQLVCAVTDTRGRTVTETLTVTVLPYANPTLSGIDIARCDEHGSLDDGGTSLSVQAVCGISPLDGHNACTLQADYRSPNGSYGQAVTLENGSTAVLWTGALSPRQTYEVRLTAWDVLGNRVTCTAVIPTDDAFFHGRQGGRGAAFGKYAEEDDLLEVAWNLKTKQNLTVEGDASVTGGLQAGSLRVGGEAVLTRVDPLDFMPVGYVYISADPTSPAQLFGGTWTRLQNTFLWGTANDSALGNSGGESAHTLTNGELPCLTGSITMHGAHSSTNVNVVSGVFSSGATNNGIYKTGGPEYATSVSIGIINFGIGGNEAHNNMPPYVEVAMWKRIA